jgi:hypothetical protein
MDGGWKLAVSASAALASPGARTLLVESQKKKGEFMIAHSPWGDTKLAGSSGPGTRSPSVVSAQRATRILFPNVFQIVFDFPDRDFRWDISQQVRMTKVAVDASGEAIQVLAVA